MWAAVIRTINSLLWTSVVSNAGPWNGGRAGVCRCSEGDHEGSIREVPQEERSPSMYIAQNMWITIKRNVNLIASIAGKPTFKICIVDVYMYTFSCQQSLLFFPGTKTCHTITDVYFSQVKNKPWIPWVILDPGTVAYTFYYTRKCDICLCLCYEMDLWTIMNAYECRDLYLFEK